MFGGLFDFWIDASYSNLNAIHFIWSPNIALKEVMSFSGHSSKYKTSAKHTLGLHLSHVKCTVIFLLHSTTETNISNECNQCRLIHNSFCECVSGLQLSFCAIEENHSKNPQIYRQLTGL